MRRQKAFKEKRPKKPALPAVERKGYYFVPLNGWAAIRIHAAMAGGAYEVQVRVRDEGTRWVPAKRVLFTPPRGGRADVHTNSQP